MLSLTARSKQAQGQGTVYTFQYPGTSLFLWGSHSLESHGDKIFLRFCEVQLQPSFSWTPGFILRNSLAPWPSRWLLCPAVTKRTEWGRGLQRLEVQEGE